MMKRFIKEYVSYKLKGINSNQLMQKEFKEEKIAEINKIVEYRKRGIISIDEAMSLISEV